MPKDLGIWDGFGVDRGVDMRDDGGMNAYTLIEGCTGPNAQCRRSARIGHKVHIIPKYDASAEALILPTYHYETVDAAINALETAQRDAVLIETDDDLYAARKAGIAHKLPIGWIDPSRR